VSWKSWPLSETETGEGVAISKDGGVLQRILFVVTNYARTILAPILQNGNRPYSGFKSNQAPVRAI
jgi:hypothetical protein